MLKRCSYILHQGETREGSHNTREIHHSLLSVVVAPPPFSSVVVTGLLLLSSTFSLACTFGGGPSPF